MNTSCKHCHKGFDIDQDDQAFYEKIHVPHPTHCPDCRRQRRLSFRNDYMFYSRSCDLCKRSIISLYNPENPQPIYCNKCWWSDQCQPESCARDVDFSRSFFEQFQALRAAVPALALVNDNTTGSENCEYVQNVQYSKNCYMAMVSWKIENCIYFSYGAEAKDAVDSMGIFAPSEGIYQTLYSGDCYGSRYIQDSSTLKNCAYCYDCHGCEDSFLCVGLRNKKYHFKNREYSKEEYEKILKDYALDSWSGHTRAWKEFQDFLLTQPRKYAALTNCVESTGNNIANCKNSSHVFHLRRAEDCKYLENGDTEKGSYDLCVGGELEECYEGLTPDHSYRALFTSYTWKSSNVTYTDFCMSCKDCFGCVGLRHKQFCILNKQYTEEEYHALKNKLIEHMTATGEWGEFFPMSCSPFAYNESMAHLSFPLTKAEALAKGLRWRDEFQETRGKTTLRDIPDTISDVPNSIVSEVLECESCQRNYKIVPDELIFYRTWSIPIPRECFYCRLAARFALRGPTQLWNRSCMCEEASHGHAGKCVATFETSYSPEKPWKLYCEECYQKEHM